MVHIVVNVREELWLGIERTLSCTIGVRELWYFSTVNQQPQQQQLTTAEKLLPLLLLDN